MFREMRRKAQLLSESECMEILKNGTEGVLAVLGDEGYPYAAPLNYAYEDGKLYFHGATAGHRVDAVEKYEKVSFCVIEKKEIVPERATTYYRSVIAFGRARMETDPEEKRAALYLLGGRYAAAYEKMWAEEIESSLARTGIMTMEIEHITGKECIELVKLKAERKQ